MKDVQISFDEILLEELDKLAHNYRVSRSEVVRRALRNWLKQKEIKTFEDEWISRLKERPDEAGSAEAWVDAQGWSEK